MAVERVRDALDLPSRLGAVDGPDPSELSDVVEAIAGDPFVANAPFEPTAEEIATVLRDAY